MKSIFLFTFITFSMIVNNDLPMDPFSYDKEWARVETHLSEGLPQSAYDVVLIIEQQAIKDKSLAQRAKCIIYIVKIGVMLDEDGVRKSAVKLTELIKTEPNPIKAIAQSYLAEMYSVYFNNNRYDLADRTAIIGAVSDDFKTWTAQDFSIVTYDLYFASIADEKLNDFASSSFRPILDNYTEKGSSLRPTLYELLADRVIEYLGDNPIDEAQNPSSFALDDDRYLGELSTFINLDLSQPVTPNNKSRSIALYSKVLKKLVTNNQKSVAAHYDLSRVKYVYSNASFEGKQATYKATLLSMAKANATNELVSTIYYELANQARMQADSTESNVIALAYCEQGIAAFPNSSGAQQCQDLKNSIIRPLLTLTVEQVNPSKRDLLAMIDYTNLSTVTVAVVKWEDQYEELRSQGRDQELKELLAKAKPINQNTYDLVKSPNYLSQAREISINKLPYGKYVVVAKASQKATEAMTYASLQISDLAFTVFQIGRTNQVKVVDRTTGKGVDNATVTLQVNQYQSGNRSYKKTKLSATKTNKEGIANVDGNVNESVYFIVQKDKDLLDINESIYSYSRDPDNSRSFVEIYMDRGIYRPGQTIYYKALAMKTNENGVPTIITKKKMEVILRDANYQEIAKTTLTTNDFGSLNGSFVLPTGKLNGYFTLTIASTDGLNGQKGFNVEEYKRPTFEVRADDITKQYKFKDVIKVTGSAQTLAGTNVDAANFTYNVTRRATFPWWRSYRFFPQNDQQFIVTQGTGITDPDGKLSIEFVAVPDLSQKKEHSPVLVYEVAIEVTDQRGETRSVTKTISIGYNSFTLTTDLKPKMDVSTIDSLSVSAQTSNGDKVSVKGLMVINSLVQPKEVPVARYWHHPDYKLSDAFYKKQLPHFLVEPNQSFEKYAIGREVFSAAFDTDQRIRLSTKLAAGIYKITLIAKDKDGVEIKNVDYMVVTDFDKGKFPTTDYLHYSPLKSSYQPGEKMELKLGATNQTVFVHYIITQNNREIVSKSVKVNKDHLITLPITEQHRGGVSISLFYVINNRSFTQNLSIAVPWKNKELDIKFLTFRDKTLPGADETYAIKISGAKKEAVIAEVLAAMYDASLDVFADNVWTSSFYPSNYSYISMRSPGFGDVSNSFYTNIEATDIKYESITVPTMLALEQHQIMYAPMMSMRSGGRDEFAMDAEMGKDATANKSAKAESLATPDTQEKPKDQPLVRKNLNELVFFYPDIQTDSDGNLILKFKMNEALTKWKLMLLAHTKDLSIGSEIRYVQTQKDLMIFPNLPRFVRDGDVISISAKVSNLSKTKLTGIADIQIVDAITNVNITSELVKGNYGQAFNIESGMSQGLAWTVSIPEAKYQAISIRIGGVANDHEDAEEATIPVLTNRVLVTETMPMYIKGNETKQFNFLAFAQNNSTTKKDFSYTIEYTTHPVWYAIQAIPFLNQANSICTTAKADELFANLLSARIVNSYPKIKNVLDRWKVADKDALLSNLSKNQELKNAILEETPWVQEAMSESEQKHNIAMLFDINQLANRKTKLLSDLRDAQLDNGGLPWIAGGRDNVFTTQYILELLGKLTKINAITPADPDIVDMVDMGLDYLDESLAKRYNDLKEHIAKHGGDINADHLDMMSIYYLYVTSFYDDRETATKALEAKSYYMGQAQKYWNKQSSIYNKTIIGLIMKRANKSTANDIQKSLRELSFKSDEMGMYWKIGNGYRWNEQPIQSHALIIEFFNEMQNSTTEVDLMKIWLLKNKQTNHWQSSSATVAAIYGLLLDPKGNPTSQSSQWVNEDKLPQITVGKQLLKIESTNVEAGSGYFKTTYKADQLDKSMSVITITNPNKSIGWGAAYYQYLEVMDNVKVLHKMPIQISKKLYRSVKSMQGDKLEEIIASTVLKPGDQLMVRIILVTDRSMEYVHLKDLRPSGLEPVNVISGYNYKPGIWYYETTKDLASHFFIENLDKGTYVFEYPLRVVHNGNFTGGIATIECMYAPEFSGHSEGSRVRVGK